MFGHMLAGFFVLVVIGVLVLIAGGIAEKTGEW